MFGTFKHQMLFVAFLATMAINSALPVRADDSLKSGKMRFEFRLSFRRCSDFTFSNFPLSNRSVPLHKDDYYLRYNEDAVNPLPDATLRLDNTSSIDITCLYSLSPLITEGIVFSMHSSLRPSIDDPERRLQQNQSGTPSRGVGNSLRYYFPNADNYVQFGLTGELRIPWLKIHRYGWLRTSVAGVYDLTGFALSTTGGWDRWNHDQDWKKDQFARMYEHRLILNAIIGFPVYSDGQDKNLLRAIPQLRASYLRPFYNIVFDDDSQDMIYTKTPDPRWEFALAIAF